MIQDKYYSEIYLALKYMTILFYIYILRPGFHIENKICVQLATVKYLPVLNNSKSLGLLIFRDYFVTRKRLGEKSNPSYQVFSCRKVY